MENVKQFEIIAGVHEIERRSVRDRGGRSVDFAEIIAGFSVAKEDPVGEGRGRCGGCQENDGNSTAGCQSDGAGRDPRGDPEASAREMEDDPCGDRGCEGGAGDSGQYRENYRNNLALPVVAPPSTAIDDDVRGSPSRSGGLCERDLKDLVRRLHHSAVAGREKVRFSSNLECGIEVRFDVRIEGKRVFVTANVPDARTGALLTISLDELRRRLAGCGLELAGFDVSMDGDKRRPHRDEPPKAAVSSPGGRERASLRARRDGDGALDVIA